MQRSRKYNVLVFDFDGTLADTFSDIAWCMERTFAHFAEPAPDESAVRAVMSRPLEVSIPKLRGKQSPPEEVARWVCFYRSIYNGERERRTSLFPGAKELLERVTGDGVPALVVSNKGSVAVASELDRLGVREHIQTIFAADAVLYQKPDPRLYHAEIKAHFPQFADREVLVIGDTEADIRFAQNAGLACCWAAYGYGNRDECLRLKPDWIIQSLGELNSLVIS